MSIANKNHKICLLFLKSKQIKEDKFYFNAVNETKLKKEMEMLNKKLKMAATIFKYNTGNSGSNIRDIYIYDINL